MRYKAMRRAGILMCLVMLCSGCQQTPREVSERMADYGDNAQMGSDDIHYCTVSELRETGIKDLGVELDNMELPDKVDFSQVESVSKLELSYEKNFTDDRNKMADLFGVDKENLEEYFLDEKGKGFESDTNKAFFAVYDNVFFIFYRIG